MADNTRVNELQDKLLKAMDILNAQALNSISFDKTITCTIEIDTDKKEGKYEVNDGNRIFTAYSSDTKLRSGDTVYVTIPEGNFENQKMIIGKKTADNAKPFNFTQPFDTFFDMTGNILGENIGNELIANALNKYDSNKEYEQKLLIKKTNLTISNYTRLALKADFKSWIKEAIRGDYGLLIIINTTEESAVNKEPETNSYSFIFNNSDMYGNPYNFETAYSQEIVIPLESVFGVINTISIYFYQNHNFYDKFNEPILCSEKGYLTKQDSNQYIKDDDGNYQLKENDTLLVPNLFVSNLYLSFGYDISTFTDDYVEIYTQNRNSYRRSTEVDDNYMKQNKKEINMRWVHLKDGVPVDMIAAAEKQTEKTELEYEVRWYKYSVGAAAADPYCGIYWVDAEHPAQEQWKNKIQEINDNSTLTNEEKETQLKKANKIYLDQIFKYVFNPDVNKQQEKIKAIVIYKDGNIPYRSNELIFENEEQLPPSKEAQHIMTALTITAKDNSNGNYMIYGQDNSIKDTEYSKETRVLEAWFDVNNDGKINIDNEKINDVENLVWIFPDTNSMIQLINGDETAEKDENNNKILSKTTVTGKLPEYKIKSYYSPSYSNNTIQCQYTLNSVVYTTEKEFTFGPAGTMGTDQTLVIDFVGDVNAIDINNINLKHQLQVQLYDNQNKLITDFQDITIEWSFYYQTDKNLEIQINNEDKTKADLIFKPGFNINNLYIVKVKIGTLESYFPLPIKRGYSYIKGPTQVIYQANGEPAYNREEYKLYSTQDKAIDASWSIIADDSIYTYKYLGKLTQEEYNKLKPCYIVQQEGTETTPRKYKLATIFNSEVEYYQQIDNGYCGKVKNNKLYPLSIYIKDAPIYGVQAKIGSIVVWTQPILVLQNQWPNGVINQWDGESLVMDHETQTILAAAISAGKKNSDNTFSGVMMGDWGDQDVENSLSQTGLYGFYHGAMSYAFKEDGTAFIGKSSMARINFDGSNATIYSSGYNTSSGGMMINLYNGGKPFIELKSAVESSGKQSSMRFDTKNSGSTIYMQNGTNQFIKISNDNVENPLSVGINFNVDWDGNINAQGGKIGSWYIKDYNLQSDDGKIVLSTEGTGTILINNEDIIIKGAYSDKNGYKHPTQITMGNNSVLHGGIIEAGTLQSNNDSNRIILDGYLTIANKKDTKITTYGSLGYFTSGIPGTSNSIGGIGMDCVDEYGNTCGEIKVTQTNSGLSFGKCYISISDNGVKIGSGKDASKELDFREFSPKQQIGIYARFA